ncbi:methionine--tRNA ligase [Oligoflexus tunisiensis]|uniref:methionine--tRNA ligase n=1 Tax=Oligoflexus tunisiensis TaxID=708132 RepID=UPI000B32CC41|nr:methionine--tRNA ligase [Oligoflexus tunisiensis]
MSGKRKIVITAALPYANGPVHIGHLVEHCMVDFWARFQRMRGHDCYYICADDTHGTPVMVNARKQGVTPEQLVETARVEHVRDLNGFEIVYDNYGSTNSPSNKRISDRIFTALKEKGHIETKTLQQAYCEFDKMFLPDRFVKGTCPRCGAPDQYGDGCENCSAVYATEELKNPRCVLCGNPPVQKASENVFVKLNDFKSFLKEWVPEHTGPEIAKKLNEWLKDDLQSWCISRDKPYFGFEIPGYPDKYFYVWFDAPIGYLASLDDYARARGKTFEDYWNSHEIFHCIGKDIIYHHSLFWPAMLKAAGLNTPTQVMVHGMLQVNGAKMSKSRGTNISAGTYLKHLDPNYLRYYLACKMSSSIDDFDLNFEDFVSRVNSDLIGKITNVASRGAQMLQKLGGKMGELSEEGRTLVTQAQDLSEQIATHYEERDFAKAIIAIRGIADEANKYFDKHEPWKLVKTDAAATIEILTGILNLFRIMTVYLKPVLPGYAAKVERLFQEDPYTWTSAQQILEFHEISPYEHLAKRVEMAQVQSMLEEAKALAAASMEKTAPSGEAALNLAPTIGIEDFQKIDLRVVKIIDAKHVEGAGKLLQLTLDLGGGVTRNVFSGIKSTYKPEELVGKLTVMVANLAPRKMKFGVSEGMVLASGDGDKLALLFPDKNAVPGQRIS